MSIIINDNLSNRTPKDIDDQTGVWESNVWRPWNSINEALTSPKLDMAYRKRGQTIRIMNGITNTEYWFRDGIQDDDLIIKNGSIILEIVPFENVTGEIILDWSINNRRNNFPNPEIQAFITTIIDPDTSKHRLVAGTEIEITTTSGTLMEVKIEVVVGDGYLLITNK